MSIEGRTLMPTSAVVDKNAPLVVHIIYRLDYGGLENGLVNLINLMPADRYRHAIVCLTNYTQFRSRLQRDDVEVYPLHKRDGKDIKVFFRLWKLLKKLQPDIVHTRNLAAKECALVAAMAGVKIRIHSEHGRDINDLTGTNKKYLLLRRLLRYFVSHYITLSKDLSAWLSAQTHVPMSLITQIYNGVDTERFNPALSDKVPMPFFGERDELLIIGTIGRMQGEKDQLTLARAFIELVKSDAEKYANLRLILVGDGVLKENIEQELKQAGVFELCWLPGARDDVAAILRSMDLFVLPSLIEGVSNTILEAMASGLPVIATKVGGNVELVVDGESGSLVPEANPHAMAFAIAEYHQHPELLRQHGKAGRERALDTFSLQRMIKQYMSVYDDALSNNKLPKK